MIKLRIPAWVVFLLIFNIRPSHLFQKKDRMKLNENRERKIIPVTFEDLFLVLFRYSDADSITFILRKALNCLNNYFWILKFDVRRGGIHFLNQNQCQSDKWIACHLFPIIFHNVYSFSKARIIIFLIILGEFSCPEYPRHVQLFWNPLFFSDKGVCGILCGVGILRSVFFLGGWWWKLGVGLKQVHAQPGIGAMTPRGTGGEWGCNPRKTPGPLFGGRNVCQTGRRGCHNPQNWVATFGVHTFGNVTQVDLKEIILNYTGYLSCYPFLVKTILIFIINLNTNKKQIFFIDSIFSIYLFIKFSCLILSIFSNLPCFYFILFYVFIWRFRLWYFLLANCGRRKWRKNTSKTIYNHIYGCQPVLTPMIRYPDVTCHLVIIDWSWCGCIKNRGFRLHPLN
ncbi:putative signal peptide protein [Puccinia sorghi]|uniref:Putative signal peptide protein n=1 Tax=Puccinia sorghi TaxID=27349 RepID=A0A0L6UIM2_9BASI|nr:putative signal peptide protein [Puccinia sorghi]